MIYRTAIPASSSVDSLLRTPERDGTCVTADVSLEGHFREALLAGILPGSRAVPSDKFFPESWKIPFDPFPHEPVEPSRNEEVSMFERDDAFIAVARAKIDSLKKAGAWIAEQQRALEELVEKMSGHGLEIGVASDSHVATAPKAAEREISVDSSASAPSDKGTKKERVREAIRSFLAETGTAPRRDILKHLVGLGLLGHEVDPMRRLGVLLHLFKDEFGSDRRGNYTLRPPGPTEPEQEAA